jgi:hypothetical protein
MCELPWRSWTCQSDDSTLSIRSFTDADAGESVRVPVDDSASFAVRLMWEEVQSGLPYAACEGLSAEDHGRTFE